MGRKQNSKRDEMLHLSQSALLEEGHAPRILQRAMAMISIATILLIIWAAITRVNEVARAEGEFVPSGYVQVVQHLEGGIVEEIMVEEGELVMKDQVLLKINGAGSDKDLSKLQTRQLSLKLQAERLRAFVESRVPDFNQITSDHPGLVQDQERIYINMVEAHNKEREVIKSQVQQRHDTNSALNARKKTIEENILLVREGRNMQKKMFEKGLASKTRYLEKQEELNTLQGEHAAIITQIAKSDKEISEFESRLGSVDAVARDQANQQLEQVESEIAENKQALEKYQDRVNRLEVRAPVEGLVKGLAVNTIGEVIAPGQRVMEIVPLGEQLVLEARIRPSDIGHVTVGQPVQVKVDSFDYTRYGVIDGTLEFISATTFLDNSNQSYYRGRVRIGKNYAGQNPEQNIVLPGMTADAVIVTGRKTVLDYLLKPVHVAASTAFTER